jgi:hypothetical protein
MAKVAAFGSLVAAVALVASCGGSSSAPTSTSTPGGTATLPPSSAAVPTTFTSTKYGYALTLPAQWTGVPAVNKWDRRSGLDLESFDVDKFLADVPGKGSFGAAGRWKGDLAAYTRFLIAFTQRTHGDFCPPKPDTRGQVTIGGQPGVLLAYNCGILINIAATVHHGVGYQFTFRDSGVAAASDSTDHATFLQLLRSVQFRS